MTPNAAANSVSAPQARPDERKVPRIGFIPSSGGLEVLVVESDKCMRELLRIHLSNAGYEVTTAEDAVVALRCLLRARPDLMILEAEMPYMSGLEFMGTLKADPAYCEIPVICLTAREDAQDAAAKLGALACLPKPLFVNRLLAAVAAALPSARIAIG